VAIFDGGHCTLQPVARKQLSKGVLCQHLAGFCGGVPVVVVDVPQPELRALP
jgi:hypothetical protein